MEKKRKLIVVSALAAIVLVSAFMLSSCGSAGGDEGTDEGTAGVPFASKDIVDLSGYDGMEGYEGESRFVETTVAEVVKLMNDKETFVVFLGFNNCPYCNAVISYVNEAAENAGEYIGYIDTRKNPSWENNMDIDDYDLFVKYFGDYLELDEDNKKHLYVPDMYFIKNGEIVARHDGVVEGADDPEQPLTKDQQKELRKILADDFEKVE